MIKRDFTISNKLGLHARPSALVTKTAARFKSEVWMTRAGRRVNAKSIMGVMMLAAGYGAQVAVDVDGEDEAAAMEAIGGLIESKFGEDE
jgi:phosphocarrier protein